MVPHEGVQSRYLISCGFGLPGGESLSTSFLDELAATVCIQTLISSRRFCCHHQHRLFHCTMRELHACCVKFTHRRMEGGILLVRLHSRFGRELRTVGA